MFPTKVVVAVDGSEEARRAARMAAEIAGRTGSELYVVHAAPNPTAVGAPEATLYDPDVYKRLREMAEERGREVLEDQERGLSGYEGVFRGSYLRVGRPDRQVMEVAEGLGAGLIVVGSRGRGPLRRALMGSVSDSVVRHAHCPVLVVRSGEGGGLVGGRILVGIDGSREASLAAGVAAEVAEAAEADLHAVFALPTQPEAPYPHPYAMEYWTSGFEEAKRKSREYVEERAAALGTERRIAAEGHLALGKPKAEIVKLGEELGANLVVVGSRGLGGIRRALLGGVSEAVTHHAHCPVLVVREAREDRDAPRAATPAGAAEDA